MEEESTKPNAIEQVSVSKESGNNLVAAINDSIDNITDEEALEKGETSLSQHLPYSRKEGRQGQDA